MMPLACLGYLFQATGVLWVEILGIGQVHREQLAGDYCHQRGEPLRQFGEQQPFVTDGECVLIVADANNLGVSLAQLQKKVLHFTAERTPWGDNQYWETRLDQGKWAM